MPNSFMRSNFGGGDVNYYLGQLLKMKGFEFLSDTEKLILHEIKKKCSLQVEENKEVENKSTPYKLPDSNELFLDHKDFDAVKVVFNPSLVGKNCLGLHQMIATSIEKVNSDLRERLYSNIKLTGGNSLIQNLAQVIHTELQSLLTTYKGISARVNSSNCTISNWNGGNIVSSLDIFNNLLISRQEWEEKGKDIVHKKTF